MRILLVSDYYPPYYGGAQRQLQLLARELARRNFEVAVATNWQPGAPAQEREDFGATVHRVKQFRTLIPRFVDHRKEQHSTPFPDPVTAFGLRRVISRFKPDIVHSYGWISYSCALALVGKRIPMIVSSRDYGYSCATRTLLYKDVTCDGPGVVKCARCSVAYFGLAKGVLAYLSIFYGRPFLLSRINGIHSVSSYVRDINRRDWVGRQHNRLAAHGGDIFESVIPGFLIEAPSSSHSQEILQRLPKEPYILYIGGIQVRKGIGQLLSAYAQLESPPPLVLIGYSDPGISKTFPPGITALQNVPHDQVMVAWEHCLFAVVPSLWPDPSPGVVREAMSQGKAVIGSAVGGITEMIQDGINGLLVPPGDIDALVAAMKTLIQDKARRARMAKVARTTAKEYLADVLVPEFEQLYNEVFEQSAP